MSDLSIQAEKFHTVGQQQFIKVGDENIACWLAGNGPQTLIFIHGNSAAKEVFFEQLAYFFKKPNIRLLAIDLPGHGLSDDARNPEKTYNISAYARLVKQVMDHFSIDRPAVVGWSLGGHVAIEMIGQGVQLAGLCITGTPPMGPGIEDFAKAFQATPATAITMKSAPTPEETATYIKGLYHKLDDIPDYFQNIAARTDGLSREHMGTHWASAKEGHPQQALCEQNNTPKLVIHGQYEQFVSRDYLDQVQWKNLWSGHIQDFKHSAHAPFVEEADRFNKMLDQFLTDVFHD